MAGTGRMKKQRHTIASRRRRFFPLRASKNADVIIKDTFTDSNGTIIADHTPDRNSPGHSWSKAAGTLQIQSNRLENRAASNTWSLCTIDAEASDVDIIATINCGDPATGALTEVAFRYSSTSNFWRYRYDYTNQHIYLRECVSGSETIRADVSKTIATDTDYTVRVHAKGDFTVSYTHLTLPTKRIV